jgi:hypothetical protein
MSGIFVVDVSVALSWLLPGEDTIRTLPLRDHAVESNRVELFVPPIFWSEVAIVLGYQQGDREYQKQKQLRHLNHCWIFKLMSAS